MQKREGFSANTLCGTLNMIYRQAGMDGVALRLEAFMDPGMSATIGHGQIPLMLTSEGAEMPGGRQEQKGNIGTISVVIPTLNAARLLPPLLAQLQDMGEVILADGGSTDGVAELAGPRVLTAPPGRGAQLAAGAAAAGGEWLLFLHADTRLGQGWEAAVADALHRPEVAHYFRFALDDAAPQARRLEAAVAWRCRWLALPYGDQGLLISRALYDSVGGYMPMPLMEDVDLVRRLGRARLAAMPAKAITSAVRWRQDGWWCRSARNLLTLGLYSVGVPPAWLARFYRAGASGPPGRA